MQVSGKDVAMLADAMVRLPIFNAVELKDSGCSEHIVRYKKIDQKLGFVSTDTMADNCCKPKGTTVATHAFSKTLAAMALARTLRPTFQIERFEDRI